MEDNGPSHTPLSEAEIQAATVGAVAPHDAPIRLHQYDASWPERFAREADRIRRALGAAALRIEHVGSTAVPGLAAKPIIDIVLEVADSAAESAYLPPLESHGYVLRIREPNWWEHRMLKGPDTDINLHVFTAGCPEVARLLQFRDRLRKSIRPRAIQRRQARAGRAALEIRAELRRRQDRNHRRHHRPIRERVWLNLERGTSTCRPPPHRLQTLAPMEARSRPLAKTIAQRTAAEPAKVQVDGSGTEVNTPNKPCDSSPGPAVK